MSQFQVKGVVFMYTGSSFQDDVIPATDQYIIYDLLSTINVQFFLHVLWETCAHKNPTKYRQSERT